MKRWAGAWGVAWGAVGWTGGLVLGHWAPVPWTAALLVTGAGLALGLLLVLLRRPLAPALVLGMAGLGLLRMGFSPPSAPPLWEGEHPVDIVVKVGSGEQVGGLWRFTGQVMETARGPLTVGDGVLVYLNRLPRGAEEGRWPPLQRGDRLYITGRVSPLPVGGVGRALAQNGVVGVMRYPEAHLVEGGGKGFLGAVERFRWRLAMALRRAIPQPQAGLGQAILLGIRGDLLPEEWEAFRQAGSAHLLAVSGLHVALVLGLLEALTAVALGRKPWALGLPLVGVWGYALLAGMGPPVVRAALMGSMALGARALGRPYTSLAALAVTVAVMAGLAPPLLGQASFQLSVAGMAGLVALGPRLQALLRLLTARWERGRPWLSALMGSTALCLGASLGAVPLAALTFERLPLWGVVATLISLPLLLPSLLLCGATALLGMAWEPAGTVAGWGAWVALAGLRWPSVWLGGMERASLPLQGIGPWVWGFYGLLTLFWGWSFLREALPQWAGGRPLAFRWAFPLLAGASALVWSAALQWPSPRVTLYALPDGSWVLVGPQGQVAVATAGSDPRPVLRTLGKHLPFWERRIALLLVPTPQGLSAAQEVLRRYRVGATVAVTSAQGLPNALPLQEGMRANLGGGVWLHREGDEPSPAFRISWGKVVWLIQGRGRQPEEDTAALVLSRERGPHGMYLVATAGGQEWKAPPGSAFWATAEQGRLWVRVLSGIP